MSLEPQIAYHRWAIARTLDACAALTVDEFTRDLGGSFPSLRDTLAHCFMADTAWAHRVRGEAYARPTPEALPRDFAALRAAWETVLEGWAELVRSRDPLEEVRYAAFDGSPYRNSVQDVVRQVVNHGSYHRGQAAMMLRLLGHAPQNTDWITFTRR